MPFPAFGMLTATERGPISDASAEASRRPLLSVTGWDLAVSTYRKETALFERVHVAPVERDGYDVPEVAVLQGKSFSR